MEVLSGVSSAFAVVSLAIELGDRIKTLCDFWSSIQEAPREIRALIKDLSIIYDVLEDIRQEASSNGQPYSRALSASLAALEQCAHFMEPLQALIIELESGFASENKTVKKWTAFRAAWKGDRIQKFRSGLMDVKMTLVLARQNLMSQITLGHHESHQRELTTIAQGMGVLLQRQASSTITTVSMDALDTGDHLNTLRNYSREVASTIANPVARLGFQNMMNSALSLASQTLRSSRSEDTSYSIFTGEQIRRPKSVASRSATKFTLQTVFGTLHLISIVSKITSSNDAEAHYETRTSITIHPSQWLQEVGIKYGVQVSFSVSSQGLDCRLKTYRAVSDESAVFRMSEDGDVDGIKALFDKGLASPWDTNSWGLTPLFFAAENGKVEVCKLLLACGADPEARSISNETVISYACEAPSGVVRCKDNIDTLRLFLSHFEFSDDADCTGVRGLQSLAWTECNHESCSHPPNYISAFYWALPILQSQITLEVPAMGKGIADLLFTAMVTDDVELLARVIEVAGDINSKSIIRWFSPGHYIATSLKRIRSTDYPKTALYGLSHGLDLHIYADENFCQSMHYRGISGNTPLSVTMRYSASFWKFQRLLQDAEVDIESFVQEELRSRGLREEGWTRDSLMALFGMQFEPVNMPEFECLECGKDFQLAEETSWKFTLGKLRIMDAGSGVEDILRERKDLSMSCGELESRVCWYCRDTKAYPAADEDNEDEEDSPFLLSL